jgi:alkylhydroperoxidase family enzyme
MTRELQSVSEKSIEALRAVGWSDEQIHDATQVIALFNYFTRLAEGLGIEPEESMRQEK